MLSVRPASVPDVPEVIALWQIAGGPTRTPPTASAVRRLLQTDPEALLVGEQSGKIVGTIIVGWDGWRCRLYRLAVTPAHRREGVATTLLGAALAHATAIGVTRIDAMVDATNDVGTGFWQTSGFTLDDVELRWSFLVQP